MLSTMNGAAILSKRGPRNGKTLFIITFTAYILLTFIGNPHVSSFSRTGSTIGVINIDKYFSNK